MTDDLMFQDEIRDAQHADLLVYNGRLAHKDLAETVLARGNSADRQRAAFARGVKLLEKAGDIRGLELQPRFPLHVRAVDAPTIAVATVLLALVALGAAFLPARRAASVSPTDALRLE